MIKIEQSGGFAGISSSNEMDSGELPRSLEAMIRPLVIIVHRWIEET